MNKIGICLKAILLYLVPAASLIGLGIDVSSLGMFFISSIFLIDLKEQLLKGDWYGFILICMVAIFLMVAVNEAVNFFVIAIARLLLSVVSNQLTRYIASNLPFLIYFGLYLIRQKIKNESIGFLFNLKGGKIRWGHMVAGFCFYSTVMIVLLTGQIISSIPANVVLIAISMSIFITGIQSWFEEFCFRQIPLSFFASEGLSIDKTVEKTAFLIISAVIFGMAHLQLFLPYGFAGVISQIIFGFFSGFMAIYTSGIEFSTGVHMANNAMIFVFMASRVINRTIISPSSAVLGLLAPPLALASIYFLDKKETCSDSKKGKNDNQSQALNYVISCL